MILGAHESTAQGLHLAVKRARSDSGEAVQIFTSNPTQWRGQRVSPGQARLFKAACAEHGMRHVVAHAIYLINMASPREDLWQKSVLALREEVRRCAALGIPLLVLHPGAPGEQGERWGVDRVARGLDLVLAEAEDTRVTILLENTAGQGTQLGFRFGQLAAIRKASAFKRRLGVCFDTQHAFAAGYDLRTAKGYATTIAELERVVGLRHVRAVHLNDSASALGSRVDGHARIGHGEIGDEGFRRLVRDTRFKDVPGILETPPGPDRKPSFAQGLRRLRRLAERK